MAWKEALLGNPVKPAVAHRLILVTATGVAVTVAMVLVVPWLIEPAPMRWLRLVPLAVIAIVCVIGRSLKVRRWPRFSLRTVLLVMGLAFCLAVLWRDGAAWRPVHQFPGFSPTAVLSPDERFAAAIVNTDNPPIEIREMCTGQPRKTLTLADVKPVTELAFSNDGTQLLMLSFGTGAITPTSSTARLIDWESGEVRRSWRGSRAGHISQSGHRFFMYEEGTPASESSIKVLQVDSDKSLVEVPQNSAWQRPLEDTISSTGQYVIAHGNHDEAYLWDVDAAREVGMIPGRYFDGTTFPRVSYRFSPDDRFLAVATRTGVDFWNVARFEQIGCWTPETFSSVGAIEWSPDGDRVFAMFIENTGPVTGREHSFLVDRNGNEIAEIEGSCGTFSPTGDRLAVQWGPIKILDGQTGKRLTTLESTPDGNQGALALPGYRAISFSTDGEWLLNNGRAAVWHRHHSERWYGILSLPAFWGADFFLIALLVPLIPKSRRKGATADLSSASP